MVEFVNGKRLTGDTVLLEKHSENKMQSFRFILVVNFKFLTEF